MRSINALSVELMEKELTLLLSFLSVVRINNLGHKLKHIQMVLMLVHTVQGLLQDFNSRVALIGPIVTDLINVPFNWWYRTSEHTTYEVGFLS